MAEYLHVIVHMIIWRHCLIATCQIYNNFNIIQKIYV